MELLLKRKVFSDKSTIGELYIGGAFECYVLEDPVREINGVPVKDWKIPGQTAIPRGRYRVKLTESPKYGKEMWQIMYVPGYSGIRIHIGNFPEDTKGCLLPGMEKGEDKVLNSRTAYKLLLLKLQCAIDDIWITIK